ncbi:tudor domain-containing protein 6 isoform X2 [Canis lupus baileyi]|uniref:tudor domain-containing protein 6 isoform X11 n=1 Tax=Canis lupus familiaris TaxID=9615 RepID=UPI0003ADB42A|nr:tudor domain-containing protein 6 isoform X11 [Canis lupus familiaris]|eukprot:XP_005627492.1 tudor domain-containing protein 6 isoform X2 [Canis lupus familiaris]
MCSTPGLPTPGASLALRVSFVDVHPEVVPVQLWGLVGERREEYVRLSREIQEAAATRGPGALGGASAAPGELCLVQVGLLWHRCRVVSQHSLESRVFLLDEGRTVTAGAGSLAPGRSEFFHLPSEVLGCVLAGLVPAGGGGGGGGGEPQHWPSRAVDFLRRLQGKQVHGRVLDVLLLHRLVLVEVPALFQQMQELGLARQVPHSLFRSLLKRYLTAASAGLGCGAPVLSRAPPKQEQPGLDYFYPQLQLGVTEPVVVTQVCHPHRIHCQLRSLSQEIHRVSESMAQIYRGSTGTGDDNWTSATREESPDKPGSPCASCGLDGHWYRALLLETFRPQRCAQVLHVDYGRKELVSCSSLRYLLPEYFRMPVVTYPCALYGLWDGGRGWSRSQVGDLKALILGQAVNAKIEFFCSFEHVYYVTLYGEDGINLNCVFGVQSCCLADRFLQSQGVEEEGEEEEQETALQSPSPAQKAGEEISLPALQSVRLKINAFYDAQVEFVKNPSEFWVRLRKHKGTFSKLMRRMCSFYSSASKLDGVVLKPEPDDLCCVKWKENGYYRAMVSRLDDRSVDVFLVDRGSLENVGWYDVRMLLPQFRRLPVLALKCTLADIWPLGKTWSQEAVSFFKKTVLHKEIVIHVLDRQDNQYVIEILDESRTGEENISKVMAQAGYAKYQEFETKETISVSAPSPGHVSNHFISADNKISLAKKIEVKQKAKRDHKTAPVSEIVTDTAVITDTPTGLVVQDKEERLSVHSPPIQNFLDMKPGSSCKGELKVGSTVEVKVSYVENPGYFWCQLTKNIQGFKTLMCNIQDYCKSTATPYQGTTPACLAKRTVNGKWSRAVISGSQSAEHVKVMFVDYGDKDMVSVKSIYSISEEFLKVKAQAFRCSLYNLIQPTGQNPFVWDEKAIRAFSEFVDNAWEDNLELKCTIFALASVHDEELFNVVDLLTPFQSACQFLVEKQLARAVKLQKPLESSVQLHSYYYSTHDMKIGTEELVYVTHIDDPWTFYCQLGRNASILEQLSYNITQLSKVLLNLKTSPLIPGTLCLAKYTDGNWYRGIITEKEPNKVFFVDFGNIYVVTSDDLLPIPDDAYDVLLLPMQAVKCSLSDIPDSIPEEITTWFQETVLDKSLKALVVAKDPDGRLIIELYDDSIQINANINEKLGLLGYKGETRKKETEALLTVTETLEVKKENMRSSPKEYLSKSAENKLCSMEILGESYKSKVSSACKETKLLRSSTKTNLITQYQDSRENKGHQVCPLTTAKKGESFAEPPLKATKLEATLSERNIEDSCNKDLPLKFSEFPQKVIMPGFKTAVYVSHINDLSDFYVQLTEDEAEITHLSERLNDVRARPEYYSGPPLQREDVICAIFPEDNLWYRAVVREQQPNDLLSVQFIDYGNVSVVHASNVGKLDLINALLPGLCIHCSLRGLRVPEILKCKEMMQYFSQRTDEVQIRCEFVKFQDKWEVILADEHGIIAEDMIRRYAFCEKSQVGLSDQIIKSTCSKSVKKTNIDTSLFLNWYKPKMKMIRAYATVIDGPEYFWCQFADTEKLQYLEVEVQTAGEQVTDWRSCVPCPHIGDPCIVRYREDGHYYRALITSICDDYLVSVRLVDFGNVEDCVDPKALWNIPSELLVVPMQAFPCCLSGFNISEGVCPQEGNDYFYEIVTEDVLEITILEIKRDVCNIPLAIVDLKSKGKSINEKMKKYSKIGVSDLPYEKKCPEIKGALGSLSPEVGLKKPSSKAGQEKTLSVEPQTDDERVEKDFNIIETKPSKFYNPDIDDIFEAFENPCKDNIGPEVLERKIECHLVDKAKFDDKYLMAGFNALLPQASETKEILELNSLEVPLYPDEESKEFLELESIELQHSLVGDEEKEELGLVPPIVPLPQGCDTEATLQPFPVQLPLSCESEKQPELELPTAQLCLDDKINPLSLRVGQKAQESTCAEDTGKSSCVECFEDQHRLSLHLHGKNHDPNLQIEMNIYKEEFTDYKNRDAISSLTLFSEEESRDGKNHDALQLHISAQPENTYTLKGFTVGSKCVVWSSLRNTWSKCEILEIAEEGTRVLNFSNGMEEIVKPENVWNGIPKLDKSPSETHHVSPPKVSLGLPLECSRQRNKRENNNHPPNLLFQNPQPNA